MIRILICDDEGIVQESLRFMIEKSFGGECEIESAKNGRTAIELTESFRPDIILMDIQMPGINGIEAMQEIRRENKNVVFIVLTAYDKFEYTQRSIDVGVLSYLTKPINRDTLTEILRKAIRMVKERRAKASHELKIKEKLEAVIPIIENGFVYSILLEDSKEEQELGYMELLDVDTAYGYVLVIECGDELHRGVLSNMVGAGIKLQKHYMVFREMVKEATGGIVGALMANKVIVLIPCVQSEEDYNERVMKIDNARGMLRKLEAQLELKFKAGIGTIKKWKSMQESYREAIEAVHQGVGKVIHAQELPLSCVYVEYYPRELEKELFDAVNKGKQEETKMLAGEYLKWLEKSMPAVNSAVRLKVLEFVLYAEYFAYRQGGMPYRLEDRDGYLETVISFQRYEDLGIWFYMKMENAARSIATKQKHKTESVVDKAKTYITCNFSRELSLEEIAREAGISPYYLSKLFKEAEGTNYIDYVTKIRMDYAKEELAKTNKSIKEICCESGYGDPNYFSRIFKKWTGMTPTEFREGGSS